MRAIYRNVSLIISKEDVKTLHLCVFIRFYIMCCKRMAWRLEDRIQCQQKMDGHGRSKGVYGTDRLLSSFFFLQFFFSSFLYVRVWPFFNQFPSSLRHAFLIPAPVSIPFLTTFTYQRQTRGLRYLGAGLIYWHPKRDFGVRKSVWWGW